MADSATWPIDRAFRRELVQHLRSVLDELDECIEEDAWTGVRWRVRRATVAHVFGGAAGRTEVPLASVSGRNRAGFDDFGTSAGLCPLRCHWVA